LFRVGFVVIQLGFVFLAALFRLFFVFVFVLILFFVFIFVLLLFFALIIVARRKRRENVFAQSRGHQLEGIGINPRIIQVTIERRKVPAGAVEEVFALGIENRFVIIVITAGYHMLFAGFGIVNGDGGM